MPNVQSIFFIHDEDKILDCTDSGIDAFGISVKTVIYFRFKTLYGLKRGDVVRKPELFSECLRDFFGEKSVNVEASIVASVLHSFHLADVRLSDSATKTIISARKQMQSSQ